MTVRPGSSTISDGLLWYLVVSLPLCGGLGKIYTVMREVMSQATLANNRANAYSG